MCDNTHIEEKNEIINSLTLGEYSVLFKRISDVRIKDIRILTAFSHFIKTVECGNSFSLAEVIKITEVLLTGAKINENAGNKIFMYDPKSVLDSNASDKLLKSSISNILSLFALNNGIVFSADVFSEKLESLETKRFLIVSPKKATKIIKYCEDNAIELTFIGEFSSDNRVVFNENGEICVLDKDILYKHNETKQLELTEAHFDSFMAGYNAVCSLVLLDTVSDNNVLRLGLDGDLASVFARFLGFYVGVNDFKPKTYRFIYTPEQKLSVSVSRPSISDGDYLFLLRLHNNQFGMTDKAHLNQLFNYLKEKTNNGIIKYAFPYTKGIESTFRKLTPDGLEYVSFENADSDRFAIVACVGRGESLNGIKIGCYKSIE